MSADDSKMHGFIPRVMEQRPGPGETSYAALKLESDKIKDNLFLAKSLEARMNHT
jgi:hypothetical protein